MKKYLFMAVAGMLALSSCSNDSDELVVKDAPQTMTFTAGYVDGDATRAAISGTSVTWESGDRIRVFSTKNSTGADFNLSEGASTNSATFTGEAVNDSKFYAVYPERGYSLEGTTIKDLNIIPVQNNPAWGSDDSEATSGLDISSAFAVAVANAGEALQFECICAILKVTLNPGSMGCDETTVQVSANEDLADQFDYDTATGTITRKTTGNYNSVQTMYPVRVKEGTRTLYLIVLPGNYNNFRLLVEGNETTFANKTKDNVTFVPGHVYDLGEYTCGD